MNSERDVVEPAISFSLSSSSHPQPFKRRRLLHNLPATLQDGSSQENESRLSLHPNPPQVSTSGIGGGSQIGRKRILSSMGEGFLHD